MWMLNVAVNHWIHLFQIVSNPIHFIRVCFSFPNEAFDVCDAFMSKWDSIMSNSGCIRNVIIMKYVEKRIIHMWKRQIELSLARNISFKNMTRYFTWNEQIIVTDKKASNSHTHRVLCLSVFFSHFSGIIFRLCIGNRIQNMVLISHFTFCEDDTSYRCEVKK